MITKTEHRVFALRIDCDTDWGEGICQDRDECRDYGLG